MFSAEDVLGKCFVLVYALVDCQTHLTKHQSNQASRARPGHKLEDIVRLQLAILLFVNLQLAISFLGSL